MVSMIVIGPGTVNFSFAFVCARACSRLVRMHAAAQLQRRDHLRHHRLVAILADAHLDLVGKVDALDALQEAVHEMLARLLALGDDVDAGILLQFDRQQRRVALGRGQRRAGCRQGAHSMFGSASHSGFGKRAGDRRRKKHGVSS